MFLPPPYGIYVEDCAERESEALKGVQEIKEGCQNAFGLVEAIIQEGEGEADNALGEQELEEELGMFYDDLEEEWLDEEEEH